MPFDLSASDSASPAFRRSLDAWITRSPEGEEPACCAHCREADAPGDVPATPAMADAATPGAIVAGDLLCARCAGDLAADAERLRAERDEAVAEAAPCGLCGGAQFVRTFEPTIIDPDPGKVSPHARRVLATGTPLCAGCAEHVCYLPAIDAAVAA